MQIYDIKAHESFLSNKVFFPRKKVFFLRFNLLPTESPSVAAVVKPEMAVTMR